MQKYRLLNDSNLEPAAKAGSIVYQLKGWDYGSANDYIRAFGYEFQSVTLKEDGDYPFFVVRKKDLELIE